MEVKIIKNDTNQRFDRFLRKYFKIYPDIKLSVIYSWIRKKQILVNGKKVWEDYRLQENDIVSFININMWKKDTSKLISPKDKKLNKLSMLDIKKIVIYENKDRIVFNKQPWILVHPGESHRNELCMNDYLARYLKENNITIESGFTPSFWYRLDKDTSWVLIAAKTPIALQHLHTAIRDREISKEYSVIVNWEFPQYLKIDKPLEKVVNKEINEPYIRVNQNTGSEAITECWKEKTIFHKNIGQLSLVKVKIQTWRRHQIRVHLSSEGFPVLWDKIYGNTSRNRIWQKSSKISRQLLHCHKYSFKDIEWKQSITFESPLPEDFQYIMNNK